VKDTITGYILETVVELGKKLRKRGAGVQAKPEAEVKAILEKQLEDLLRGSALDDAINPLLGVEGNIYVLVFSFTFTFRQDSMFIRTRRQKFYIRFYWESSSTFGVNLCIFSRRQSFWTFFKCVSTLSRRPDSMLHVSTLSISVIIRVGS
jgi:hypothetical protein